MHVHEIFNSLSHDPCVFVFACIFLLLLNHKIIIFIKRKTNRTLINAFSVLPDYRDIFTHRQQIKIIQFSSLILTNERMDGGWSTIWIAASVLRLIQIMEAMILGLNIWRTDQFF